MALQARTFATARELADFMTSNSLSWDTVLSLSYNSSGFVEIIYDNGEFAYEAGTGGGTVTVPAGAVAYTVSAAGSGGAGTVTIAGGDAIPVPAGGSFELDLKGRKIGEFDIVFSVNLDYFVSWVG